MCNFCYRLFPWAYHLFSLRSILWWICIHLIQWEWAYWRKKITHLKVRKKSLFSTNSQTTPANVLQDGFNWLCRWVKEFSIETMIHESEAFGYQNVNMCPVPVYWSRPICLPIASQIIMFSCAVLLVTQSYYLLVGLLLCIYTTNMNVW